MVSPNLNVNYWKASYRAKWSDCLLYAISRCAILDGYGSSVNVAYGSTVYLGCASCRKPLSAITEEVILPPAKGVKSLRNLDSALNIFAHNVSHRGVAVGFKEYIQGIPNFTTFL